MASMRVEPLRASFMPASGIVPRAAAGPTDQVELSGRRPGLPGASASEGALGGLAGAVAALEGLKSRGFEFQRKRLVGSLGWTPSTPLQAGQALLNKDPDDLRVRAPEGAWLPLRGPDDLAVLTAFHAGEVSRLPSPELARQLEQLERSGQVFEHEGQPVGSWGAYLRLTSGVSVTSAGRSLESGQDVAMLAYLLGQVGPEALEQPELARGLRMLQEEGYRSDALELYRARASEVPLSWHERELGSWQVGQDPEAVCKAMKEKRLCQAREQVAPVVLRPELLDAAARELDALPLATHPAYLDWLGRLEHPAAAARLARQEPAAQDALRKWLDAAVPRIVAQHTWAEKDGVWDDSPGAPYKDNQQSSLSLPVVDLRHASECTLSFRCQTQLEKGRDWLVVEASADGKSWEALRQITDKSNWTEHQVSLVAYQGAPVHVRFRLSSDSSVTQEGVSLSHISLEGRPRFEAAPRSLFQQDRSQERAALAAEVARLVAGGLPIEPLQQLVAGTGSVAEALRLGPIPPESVERVAHLAERLGNQAAAALAPFPGEVDRMVASFQAAGRLTPTPDDLSSVMAVYRELAQLPPESQEHVARLVQRTCPTWSKEGGWHSIGDGAWADSPGLYRHGQNASLTTSVLDLRHHSAPTVSFRARHDLERNADNVLLEASRDGQQWEGIAAFTGQSDWAEHKLSLAPFGQGMLQLRFRLKTDSSNNGEGLELADFRVEARPTLQPEAPPELVFSDQARSQRATLDQILELARQRDLEGLERVDRLSQDLRPDQALRLFRLQAPAESLSQAAVAVGVEATAALFPEVQSDSVQAFQLATQIANRLQQPELLDRCLADSRALRGTSFPEGLLESLHPWQTEGWVRSEPGVWADNRIGRYRSNANNSLTSPVISLAGQQGARVRFDYQCDLEKNSDFVRLEVRPEGGKWQPLQHYTGQVPQGTDDLDLSDLGEGRVELRWRMTSDSSSEGQGFKLRNLRVEDSTGQIFFSDRPEDLAPLRDELISRMDRPLEPLTELVKAHGLCAALAITTLTDEPERHKELERLVAISGVSRSLQAWEEIGSMPLEALQAEVDLRSECARFRSLGVEPERLLEALREASLDKAGTEALGKLRDGLGQAGWKPSGDWGRTLRGWSDSPAGNYRSNQNAALESPPTWIPPGAKLSFEARYQFEKGPDRVHLQVLPEGKKDWEEKALYTGNGSGRQEVDLSAYGGQTVRLRFLLRTDSSSEYPGLDFWDLKMTDAGGESYCLDELGQRSVDGLLELACTPELQLAERSRALQILSRVPAPLAAPALRALSSFFENQEPERALALVERLPEVVLDSAPEAAMDRLLESLGPRLREESEAVLVGGVRVRKR
ncbi:MAG: hypothetical protein AMXMBFR33_15550 [Candidatus Xenobia bacterium]